MVVDSFLRWLIDRVSCLKRPSHRTRLTQDMRYDLEWWIRFLGVWNGIMPMLDNRPGYHYQPMPAMWRQVHISKDRGSILRGCGRGPLALEPAVAAWGHLWRNRKVYVHCDNQEAVAFINKGTCRNNLVMDSLRRIYWASAIGNFRLKAIYYPGISNTIADRVSRLHEPNGYENLVNVLCKSFSSPNYASPFLQQQTPGWNPC